MVVSESSLGKTDQNVRHSTFSKDDNELLQNRRMSLCLMKLAGPFWATIYNRTVEVGHTEVHMPIIHNCSAITYAHTGMVVGR